MVNTMGWNERSDPDMRTANFCDVYREGVYCDGEFLHSQAPIHIYSENCTYLMFLHY